MVAAYNICIIQVTIQVKWNWFILEAVKGEEKQSGHLAALYGNSLALLTDLYQLTMAYAYWKESLAARKAVFHLSFRRAPFQNGFAIAAGLATALEYLDSFRFSDADLDYLEKLRGPDGTLLFSREFLEYLRPITFQCEVHAVAEGTVIFPHEPLLRIQGPLLQCQIVETALLNIVNFQTLIATKAARICEIASPAPVIEFGLRRAQGIDGGISASRAAYIGGCQATSNVLAGKFFGIPVSGTHAHSWVLSFDSEREAFEAYARAMPGNSLFLVDTYDTLEGVAGAIEVGRRLRQEGYSMLGIRLDSGNLNLLSKEARRLLDEAGFEEALIVATNDLDEQKIGDLKKAGAPISVWGVGTRLATGFDEPALGGIYKMSAIQDADGVWQHKLKLSQEPAKIGLPGILQVHRFRGADGAMLGDLIFDELQTDSDSVVSSAHSDPAGTEDLLEPVFSQGGICCRLPSLTETRAHCSEQLRELRQGQKLRKRKKESYDVEIERMLESRQRELIRLARGSSASPPATRG